MKADVVIRGGEVVAPGVRPDAVLVVRDGRIAEILDRGHEPAAREVIDARDRVVLAGVVDPHVHVDTPGPPDKPLGIYADSFESMTRAAAFGGVTTALAFVFAGRDPAPAAYLERCRDLAEAEAWTDFGFHFGIVREADVEAIADVAKLGVRSFKAMMDYKPQGIMVGDGLLAAAMTEAARHRGLMMVRAEDGEIIAALEGRARAAGDTAPPDYARARPAVAEQLAVLRALALARATGCPLYIVHLSTREGLEAVRAARAQQQRVIVETCPHYLLLTSRELEPDRLGPLAKIGPPLRTDADTGALWSGVLDGTVDCLGSDHAPRRREQKLVGLADIFAAPFGGPGLETLLPVLFDLFRARGLPLLALSRLVSEMPARIFGLHPRKGTIAPGADADVVIVDPDAAWTFDPGRAQTNAKYSLWAAHRLVGKPLTTIVRGRAVVRDGHGAVAAGHGRFLAHGTDL